jgi:phenylalanyl-tRNA synthetase beta chain
MKFSYNWLQSFFERKLPEPEKLAEILTMHSFEVEDLNKIQIGSKVDWQLDIDVLPNRTDCYSHLGIAKEISAILNYKLQIKEWELKEEKKFKTNDFLSLKVMTGCQRYTGKVILEPKIDESPNWLRERLEVCGLKPINNIVDITNYVMLELGQPLHAFDLDKIEGKKIIVRFAKKGEKILTLDDEEYSLDKEILVIADSKKPIAIAGIKGGKETGISQNTKIIFLESANFDPVVIRRGSIKIDLRTDASLRFSHGIDPNLTQIAIKRAAFLIQEISQGKVASGILDFYPKKVYPKKIKLEKDYLESILGIKIPTQKIIKILNNLGLRTNQKLIVEIPTVRRDISLQEDLIEEVGRIYGYEKIKKSFPIVSLLPPKRNLDIFWENQVKEILRGMGFSEVYNYSFLPKEDIENFGFQKEVIEVENPVSALFQFLRPSLMIGLIKNVQRNKNYFKEIKIFEIGKIFRKEKREKKEKKMLSGVIFGGSFFEGKGVIDALLKKLGISNFYFDFYKPTPEESKISVWHKRKSAEIKIDNTEIGFLGEISKRILEKYEIEENLVAFDIDFEKLANLASEEHEYEPISIYPAVIRDISVLVPKEVLVEDVLNEIERAGGELIRDIDLFDVYEELEEERKSLAFHLIFQSKEKALLPSEVDKIQEKIIENLEKNPNWEVRKQ